jgi:tripartite-type tricarboxylate transporter receptor subunit TctC
MQKAARSPLLNERYAALGADPVSSTPEEFTAHIRQEFIKWAKVVKRANIKL